MAFELELVLDSSIWNVIGQPENYAQFVLSPKTDGHFILHAENTMPSTVHAGTLFWGCSSLSH